jgi:formate-dependent nitrite reductase membrane component NrfD
MAYAIIGSFFGFFVAVYTGVLLNTTARPLWEDPLIGSIFFVSVLRLVLPPSL